MKRALVVVDIQNDYFEGGNCVLHEPQTAAKKAKSLIDFFHDHHEPVIYICHINQGSNQGAFVPDSVGSEIYAEIQPADCDHVFIKHVPDSFEADGFWNYLRQESIQELIVCGMMSHMCIDTTVRSARVKGYEVIVAEDACTTMSLEWDKISYPAETVHAVYMASLSGAFAKVMKTDVYLEQA